mmetsp:Transcript_4968/g.10822  ORF Transcript_4968/g.10822 Transcript_4968/m.10822 type:complete len:266 (-) Transcript_4968:976-1773(-)
MFAGSPLSSVKPTLVCWHSLSTHSWWSSNSKERVLEYLCRPRRFDEKLCVMHSISHLVPDCSGKSSLSSSSRTIASLRCSTRMVCSCVLHEAGASNQLVESRPSAVRGRSDMCVITSTSCATGLAALRSCIPPLAWPPIETESTSSRSPSIWRIVSRSRRSCSLDAAAKLSSAFSRSVLCAAPTLARRLRPLVSSACRLSTCTVKSANVASNCSDSCETRSPIAITPASCACSIAGISQENAPASIFASSSEKRWSRCMARCSWK